MNNIDECYEVVTHMHSLITEQTCRFLGNSTRVMNLAFLWRFIQLKTSYHKMVMCVYACVHTLYYYCAYSIMFLFSVSFTRVPMWRYRHREQKRNNISTVII